MQTHSSRMAAVTSSGRLAGSHVFRFTARHTVIRWSRCACWCVCTFGHSHHDGVIMMIFLIHPFCVKANNFLDGESPWLC